MKKSLILVLAAALAATAPALAQTRVAPAALTTTAALPAGVTLKEARFFSEQVEISGRLFLPAGFSATANAPAVVLAPGWGQTAASLDAYAAALAGQGVVAMTVDYTGWGRSGGFVYLNEDVAMDDRLRFSLHTPQLVIRRGRLDPDHQIQDLRNAITFLQTEPGVDRNRIGILGADIGGGHVISVLGMDARVKAGVAVTPVIAGRGVERRAFVPSPQAQAEMVQLARTGRPPQTAAQGTARNAQEARLALAEYLPFWRLDAIPATAAVQFITAGSDERVNNADHAVAAAEALKGPKEVRVLAGAKHILTPAQTLEAASAAATWLKGKL